MEKGFKFLFFFGIFVYSLISVGIFMLILRILLIFFPELRVMGMTVVL